jgi:hypothetical protein
MTPYLSYLAPAASGDDRPRLLRQGYGVPGERPIHLLYRSIMIMSRSTSMKLILN